MRLTWISFPSANAWAVRQRTASPYHRPKPVDRAGVNKMRAVKLLAWVAGGLVALVAVLLAGVLLFVNPNDYKDRIAAGGEGADGAGALAAGELKLSVFPWLALQVGEARLGNRRVWGPALPDAQERLAAREAAAPAAAAQAEVDRVTMDGLQLALKRNEAGKGNWEIAEGDRSDACGQQHNAPPSWNWPALT